jgi:glucose-1-phosphate thymidylyltransferase
MKALILAAGFSTRLYPLTKSFPKGLLEVQGEKIIVNILDKIIDNPKIDQYALITNQVSFPHFKNFLNGNEKYSKIKLLNNRVDSSQKSLGAIGDLLLALDELGWEDDLLVLPSDTLVSLDFTELINFFEEKKSFVNVVYDAHDKEIIKNKLGCAQLAGDKLINFEEKPAEPKSTFQSVPIYIYSKNDLKLVREYVGDEGNSLASPGSIVPFLIEKTEAFAFQIRNGFYHDVGTKEVLEKLKFTPQDVLK